MNDQTRFWIEVGILVVTIFAVYFGPIRAVKITRQLDDRRADRERKYTVLSDLMRTRRARLETAHIYALNLIELEFHHNKSVIEAYRTYARHLASYPEESQAIERHAEEGHALFSSLLKEIAQTLGYQFDKDDLNRLSYFPRGIGEHQDAIFRNAKLLSEVLEGRRSIPIVNFIKDDRVFPPTPSKDSES